ncbi:MAG: nitronate monooxygenase [Proteobacteria bacterium]|nr:nitronate monooxygenase [Pseudomonadota bacterium]
MNTRVAQLLGTRYPIVLRAQRAAWLEAAAAMSNAGGLGLVPVSTHDGPQGLARDVERCRGVTGMPLGVSLDVPELTASRPYEDYLAAAKDTGVRVLECTGTLSKTFIEKCKRQDLRVIHRCSQVRDALMAERNGVDAISVGVCDGNGADNSRWQAWGGCAAEPAATLRIPVLAEGYFARGSAMAAALALGAEGFSLESPPASVFNKEKWELMVEAMVNDCVDSLRQALVRVGLGAVSGEQA